MTKLLSEGYAATAGKECMRPALYDEALRVARILAELVPTEPEAQGLVAVMERRASRTAARVSASGELILLLRQNRNLCDLLLIRRGLAALTRAQSVDGPLGPYTLQGAIAASRTPESDGKFVGPLEPRLGSPTSVYSPHERVPPIAHATT